VNQIRFFHYFRFGVPSRENEFNSGRVWYREGEGDRREGSNVIDGHIDLVEDDDVVGFMRQSLFLPKQIRPAQSYIDGSGLVFETNVSLPTCIIGQYGESFFEDSNSRN